LKRRSNVSLFDKATDGITHLIDGDKDGSAIDDVFKFAAGGVTGLMGDVAGLIPGPEGKIAGNLIKTVSAPITAGAELRRHAVGLFRHPGQDLVGNHR
jgi:hypothetical protein